MPSLALDLPHSNTHVPHVYRTPRHSMNFAEHLHHRAGDAYGLFVVLRALADFHPMAFELSCIFYLTSLKIYIEVIAPKAAAADIVDVELSNSDRVGRSATVQEELKPCLLYTSPSPRD